MKKTVYLLLLVLALGVASCDHKPKTNATKVDVVLVNKGQISFYDADAQKVTPYEKETDSVINLMFDDNNHLFYTVSKNKDLSLKMLDLNQENLEPKHCADWPTTLDLATDFITGGASGIFMDEAGENVFIYQLDTVAFYNVPLIYNIKSGKVRKAAEDELFNFRYDYPNCNTSHLYTENHLYYYVTPEGKICLNDKVDFLEFFSDEDEYDDLEFNPISLSPDGKSMAYTAAVYWGEGWGYYCVSNLDGSMQTVLKNTDIWDDSPKWLDNGKLVFIDNVPIPESDPEYDLDWRNIRPTISIFDPQKNTISAVSLGDNYAVRPRPMPERKDLQQKNLEGCDMAIFDKGKVTFYNSSTKEFVPFIIDDDSIVNGVLADEYTFYYTVDIAGELYLKQAYLGEYCTPMMLTCWDLSLDDCISETYGKVSPLIWLKAFDRVGINYNFNWDFYDFADIKFYDIMSHKKVDGWTEDEDVETDVYDDEYLAYQDDYEHFSYMDGNFYYLNNDHEVCVSDKINFKDFVSDPEYYSEPEFEFRSIDPTRRFAAYATYIEWGDLGHGPLCIASLDGKMQMALKDTDVADLTYGWLSDGSLLYVGAEPRPADDPEYDAEWNNTKPCIMIVKPDGTQEVFSHATEFVVREK